MFFRKVTSKSSGKEYNYLKLIENYREGDKVKQRVVANLGSMDKLTPEKVNGLITGLTRICGVSHLTGNLETKKILNYGDVLAIQKIWDTAGVEDALEDALKNAVYDFDLATTVKIMVMSQMIKPHHSQIISDWHHNLYLPEGDEQELISFHFQRALDIVADAKEELEAKIFSHLNSYFQINTDLAFCRLTASTVEPDRQEEFNLTAYGKYILSEAEQMQKVDFGLLVSRDGMPMGHQLLHQAMEEWELKGVLDYLKRTFGIDRCIFVGERSMANNPNLEVLVARGYDYIIGRTLVSAQDYNLLATHLAEHRADFNELDENLWYKEIEKDNVRYLLCYNPQASAQMKEMLLERLDAVEQQLRNMQKSTYKKNAPVFKDNYCRKFFTWQFNESGGEFTYQRLEDLVSKEADLAGAFIVETNDQFLRAQEILKSYVSLVMLGDSFQQIRNFEPRQSYLYTEQKISANIFICVLAAMLEKVIEKMIRQAGLSLDVQHALHLLGEIKVVINHLDGQDIKSITSIDKAQEDIFNAIGLFKEQRTVV